MQDIEQLTASEMAVMEALGRFRYMTTPQLVRAGASPSMRHVQRVLRRLIQRARPLAGGLEFGSIPTIGRLHRLHYLTERGATVLEDAGHDWDSIKFPHRVRLFPHDYWHRVACVDFHVSFALWASMSSTEIGEFNTYYDHGKIGADGRAHPRSRVAWAEGSLVPDAIFTFTPSDNIARLCAFEMHKGKDTARLAPKLKSYLTACRNQAMETPYGLEGSARVLLVFDDENTLQKIRGRIEREDLLQDREKQFFGKTLADIETDFKCGWWPLGKGDDPVNLF